jgi:hypothetical protein
MSAPNFPFNDSLQLLQRRQDPIFQTGRGNYATTWIYADFWQVTQGQYLPIALSWKEPEYSRDVLLFGSDVPQLATLFYRQQNTVSLPTQLATWIAQVTAAMAGIYAFAQDDNPPTKPAYTGAAPPVAPTVPPSIVCPSGQVIVSRPAAMEPSWNATDMGQGTLVIAQTEQVANVQGFPLRLPVPRCDGAEPTLETYAAKARLLVGFESQINHGLGESFPTGQDANAQLGYYPIILRRDQYTPAIRANDNVITIDFFGVDLSLLVVGLWF